MPALSDAELAAALAQQAGEGKSAPVLRPAAGETGSFMRGLLQGGTAEWFDELANLGNREGLEESRRLTRAYANAAPFSYNVGKFAGSMALPMGWAFRLARGGMGFTGAARAGATVGAGMGAVE